MSGLTRLPRYKFPSSRRIWSNRHQHCNERCHLVFEQVDVSADFENANENRGKGDAVDTCVAKTEDTGPREIL